MGKKYRKGKQKKKSRHEKSHLEQHKSVPMQIDDDDGEVVPYVPDAPDLKTTMVGAAICTALIFAICQDHPLVTRAILSFCTAGLFLLRYFMGLICPDPYAPVSEAEIAEATDMGFAGDPDYR